MEEGIGTCSGYERETESRVPWTQVETFLSLLVLSRTSLYPSHCPLVLID